jgi:LacI family transcriptional regulator
VIGVDDSPQAEFANPPLTTVRLPTSQVGELAAEKMTEMLTGKKRGKAASLEVKGELAVRGSTAPPRSAVPVDRPVIPTQA